MGLLVSGGSHSLKLQLVRRTWAGHYRELTQTVETAPIEAPALRDPDDEAVLACALAARAEAIVSGDADLHALGSYQGIPILSAAAALARILSKP